MWKTRIENDDSDAVWRALHRLVAAHPLVRSAQRCLDGLAHPGALSSLGDLTQDLYLLLLEKARFAHYLESQMSDAEIEREILQVELRNLLIARLRRQRPENYRLVRRIGDMLEADPRFRAVAPARGHASTETLYGLCAWDGDKPVRDSGTFTALVTAVPARLRNRRRVGCRGEAQVIITNQELGDLLRDLLQAIDSPATLRVLRTLALAKLPVYDAVMTSIEGETDEARTGRSRAHALTAAEASPEQLALRREQEVGARRAAAEFLDRLRLLTRAHPQRTERLWRVLWHCYFDPTEPSQLAIAALIGISDSSVSDYRRRLEAEIRKLGFTPEQLGVFAEELDAQLRRRLCPEGGREGGRGGQGGQEARNFFLSLSPSLPLSGVTSPPGL